jgi:hypothetical protein
VALDAAGGVGRFDAPAVGQFPRYVATNRTNEIFAVFISKPDDEQNTDTNEHRVLILPGSSAFLALFYGIFACFWWPRVVVYRLMSMLICSDEVTALSREAK